MLAKFGWQIESHDESSWKVIVGFNLNHEGRPAQDHVSFNQFA